MPETKRQLSRMIKLVAELKQNKYPNAPGFSKKLSDDIRDPISCASRTIERDIAFLKKKMNAPIEYDAERKGYFLKNTTWKFAYSNLSEEMMASAILGARLAEDIMPEPIKSDIRDAVAEHLATNDTEELENAFIDSLLFASGVKADIEPETFKTVFDAWRQRHSIEFTYKTPNRGPSARTFEPHVVSFHNGLWYAKGLELPEGKIVVFAIHRMGDVRMTDKTFEIDKNILDDVKKNGLFGFPKRDDIKVRCDASIAFYLRERETAQHLNVSEPQADGSVIVTLPETTENDAIRWMLGEVGRIQILEPVELRQKVVNAALAVIKSNS